MIHKQLPISFIFIFTICMTQTIVPQSVKPNGNTATHLETLKYENDLDIKRIFLKNGVVNSTPVNSDATHAGMSWKVLEQRSNALVLLGVDSQTNPYKGDTPARSSLPVLCLNVNKSTVPAGIKPDFYNGWARGTVALTPSVPGTQLDSRAAADSLCAYNFGDGWRMAEFHDGRFGANLSQIGGWHFWASGTIPIGTRFWVAINDQPANPWNK
jgi:hypothetical protein